VGACPTVTHPSLHRLPVNLGSAYPLVMNAEELKALARAVEPLQVAAGGLQSRDGVAAYNDLVSRFRERVTRALNGLLLGQAVDPELNQELWLMAKELPGMRRRAEAAARRPLSVPGG
jgi:hypothetical protein